MARGAQTAGWRAEQFPLSDGGDGFLDVLDGLGGDQVSIVVTGPLGQPVRAAWRLCGDMAIVEMAQASGLSVAGGIDGNDAMAATTRGTGELIVAASASGRPRRVIVGLGGSATTDGGLGAVMAIEEAGGIGSAELIGACDVDIGFGDAARRFARQKGADVGQVRELVSRLERVAIRYERHYGVDVRHIPGAGAAGGLGGAILALGGTLRSGYAITAELLGFSTACAGVDAVVTGEGSLDSTSFAGKVVGEVLTEAASLGVPALVVVGRADDIARHAARRSGARVVSLTERFGEARARRDTVACIEAAVADALGSLDAG